MPKNSVFLITTIFPPDTGGPATHIAAAATALFARGWRVGVVTYTRNPLPMPFPVISVAATSSFFSAWRLFRALFRDGRDYDVWYAHGGLPSTLPAIVASYIARRRCGIKITGDYAWETARNRKWIGVGIDDFQKGWHGFRSGLLAFVRAHVARHADLVVVPSCYLENMVAGWGVDRRKIAVVRNAVPSPKFVAAARDSFLFFSAGRLVTWKKHDGLLRAFARCVMAEPRARLVIAGDGPEGAALRRQATELGIAHAVDFTGTLTKDRMEGLYARAGCFVLFSEYEGMPHALIEARAYGMPIITADAGGVAETVRGGVDALLVRHGDEAALVAAMEGFLKDPASVPRAGVLPYAAEDAFDDHVAHIEKILRIQ